MNKKRVAFDVDGVLADTVPYWLERYNAHAGTQFVLDDVKDWQFSCIPSEGKPFFWGLMDDPTFWLGIKPMPSAVEAMQVLWEQCECLIVTAAPFNMARYRAEWLKTHFPFITDKDIVFTGDIRAKKYLDVDVLIDDCPLLEGTLPKNTKWFVWDAPYNRDVKADRSVRRCKDWPEIKWLLTESCEMLGHDMEAVYRSWQGVSLKCKKCGAQDFVDLSRCKECDL